METLVSRLETVTQKLERVAQGGSQSSYDTSSQPFVAAYTDLIKGPLTCFLDLSRKIGGDVATQSNMVKAAFEQQSSFLSMASQCIKPSDSSLPDVVKPLSTKICEIQTYKEQNRRSNHINHLSAIAESIAALGWVMVYPTPAPHVKEMTDSGQFYANRVLKEFKEKDETHVAWVKAWMEVLGELSTYVKKFHTTGVAWNCKGGDASSFMGAPSSAVAPPPPPPGLPPPPPPSTPLSIGGDSGGDSKAELFAALNKGEGITSTLKKVSDDQKTHKNPALRSNPTQPPKTTSSKPQIPLKTVGKAAKKPPKLELEGKKWIVENHVDNSNIQVTDTEMKQTVYIYNCHNCTINVKGKINAITMDTCKRTALAFEECISSMDFINCQSVKAQVTGKVPIMNIDKTDGCMVYLSKTSLSTQIVTAKSSEMNVSMPDDQNEYIEMPIPEQFRTFWDGKKLVTEVTDNTG